MNSYNVLTTNQPISNGTESTTDEFIDDTTIADCALNNQHAPHKDDEKEDKLLKPSNVDHEYAQEEDKKWFLSTFGPACSPTLLLGVLCQSKETRGMEAVRLVKLACPCLKRPLEDMLDDLRQFEACIQSQCYGYKYRAPQPLSLDDVARGWTLNGYFLSCLVPEFSELARQCTSSIQLASMIEEPQTLIHRIMANWSYLRALLLEVKEAPQIVSPFVERLDSAIPLFETVRSTLIQFKTTLHDTIQEKRLPTISSESLKSASVTHLLPIDNKSQRKRSGSRTSRPQSSFRWARGLNGLRVLGSNIIRIMLISFYWLENHWEEGNLGSRIFAKVLIYTLSAAAALTTALAIWKYSSPASMPLVDSNFWSCIAQQLLGLAGLYCIIIPMLQRKSCDAKQENLFKAFLIVTFIAGVVAIPVYPFQQQSSMALTYISGLCGLLATLQLITDQTQNIAEQIETIEGLRSRLGDT